MKITREFIDSLNRNTLYQTIGISVEEVENGTALLRMAPKAEVCWPSPAQPHGGIIFTLMDTAMAWAVLAVDNREQSCTTISSDIQYTAPARGDFFLCRAQVSHKTGRMSFVKAEILDDADNVVAVGQAVFRMINMELKM